jgi:uncharacterized membrane protein
LRAQLRYRWRQVVESLWFVPGAIVLCCLIAVPVVHAFESTAAGRWLADVLRLSRVSPDAARTVLSAIAGSMITVTSLVFSMVLVVLTLASQQLGPRLLGPFIADRTNQAVLGTFIGSFAFALASLLGIRGTGETELVSGLAVGIAVGLALTSCVVLVYFVHHVATAIQTDQVVARVGLGLDAAVERMFPAADERDAVENQPRLPAPPTHGERIRADASGYIQAVDPESLVEIARDSDVCLHLVPGIGDFVMPGGDLVLVDPADRLDPDANGAVRRAVVLGGTRSPNQDVRFAVAALVEIALRALSPSMNDPRTAIACIDRLAASFGFALARGRPRRVWTDDEGVARLVLVEPQTFGDLMDAFAMIRQSAGTSPSVLERLVETLTVLAHAPQSYAARRVLLRQRVELGRCADRLAEPFDRNRLRRRLGELDRALGIADEPFA